MGMKTIIGCGYVPRDVKAVCLKTDHETRLDGVEYKIIMPPYERSFVKIHNPGGTKLRYDAMAVNILDPLTGLIYAVEYHPANLVRENAAAPESPKMDSAALSERVRSFMKELEKIMKNNPEVEKDCGVLLIYNRINEEEKTCTGGQLFGGNSRALQIGLDKTCRENPEFYAFLSKAVENVASKKAFDLALRLGGIVCGKRDE